MTVHDESHDGSTPRPVFWPRDEGDDGRRWTVSLPVRRETIDKAAGLTALVLRDWHLSAVAADVGLCVSELVGNAYRHGTDWAASPVDRERARIRLGLRVEYTSLYVDVRDYGGGAPILRPPPRGASGSVVAGGDRTVPEDGRGLHLVQALSDGLTWHHLTVGKVVTCWFDTRRGHPGDAEP